MLLIICCGFVLRMNVLLLRADCKVSKVVSTAVQIPLDLSS